MRIRFIVRWCQGKHLCSLKDIAIYIYDHIALAVAASDVSTVNVLNVRCALW